jgi:hypothetical protein
MPAVTQGQPSVLTAEVVAAPIAEAALSIVIAPPVRDNSGESEGQAGSRGRSQSSLRVRSTWSAT